MKYFLLLLSTLCLLEGAAQSTFSFFSKLSYVQLNFYDTYATDSCFYIIGLGQDPATYEIDLIVLKVDTLGKVVDEFAVKDSVMGLGWPNLSGVTPNYLNAPYLKDTYHFFVCANSVEGFNIPTSPTFIQLIPNRTLRYKKFIVPPDSIERAVDVSPFQNYSSLFLTDRSVEVSGGFYKDELVLRKIGANGNLIWTSVYTNGNLISANALTVDKSYNIYIGGHTGNFRVPHDTLINRAFIVKLDPIGNFVQYFDTPDTTIYLSMDELFSTEDGGIAFVSEAIKEVKQTDNSILHFKQSRLVKLDQDFELEWEVKLDSFHRNGSLEGATLLENGDFLVYGSVGLTSDSLPFNGANYAWLKKVSSDGELLWERYLIHSKDTRSAIPRSVSSVPGGGYFLVGYLSEYITSYVHGGWWTKLDSMGCIVPGCHLATSIENPQQPSFQLSLFPNPATEHLYVHINNPKREQLHLQIMNASGQLLREQALFTFPDLTQQMDLDELSAGLYFIKLIDPRGRHVMQKFVVER